MKKFKLKSSRTHFFEVSMKRLGGFAVSFVLVLTSGVLIISVIHLNGRKTTENDTPFRRSGQVLSAQETIDQNKLLTGANFSQYLCPPTSPIKGILDNTGKKYYLKPSNSQYLYTRPDSCFGSTQNAEAEEYFNLSGNENQNIAEPLSQPEQPAFSPAAPSLTEKLPSQTAANPTQNIVYESALEQLPQPEVTTKKLETSSEKIPQKLGNNLSFEQMLERSKQTKVIVVNLSTQNLKTLDNGEVLIDTKITSGRKSFDTPLGARMVINKAQNVRLKAPSPRFGTYDLPAKYWIGMGNGYGFHDASWRSSFGGEDFVTTGSHGCINMPTEAVKSLYSWADTDTEVYII